MTIDEIEEVDRYELTTSIILASTHNRSQTTKGLLTNSSS